MKINGEEFKRKDTDRNDEIHLEQKLKQTRGKRSSKNKNINITRKGMAKHKMIKKQVSDTEISRVPHQRNLYQLPGSKKSCNQKKCFTLDPE
jgi:hypothetical protein